MVVMHRITTLGTLGEFGAEAEWGFKSCCAFLVGTAKCANCSDLTTPPWPPSSSSGFFTEEQVLITSMGFLNLSNCKPNQVWSLTQFYYVDFSQSRIGVNKCAFNKCTEKVCVSCC